MIEARPESSRATRPQILPGDPSMHVARCRRPRRCPAWAPRTDNSPEFTSRPFMARESAHGIRHILIEPGRPMQNGCIESFSGKFRDSGEINDQQEDVGSNPLARADYQVDHLALRSLCRASFLWCPAFELPRQR